MNGYLQYMLITASIMISILLIIIITSKHSSTYKIHKRLNYSGIWILKVFINQQLPFQAKVTLDKSFEVKTLGVQKIFGIGNILHHKRSDRYGLIYEGDSIFGIYSYQYRDGKCIPWKKLGSVETGVPFYITFKDSIVDKYKIGRFLYPYFEMDGDSEKGAPHTMKMDIEFHPLIDICYIEENKKENIEIFSLPNLK